MRPAECARAIAAVVCTLERVMHLRHRQKVTAILAVKDDVRAVVIARAVLLLDLILCHRHSPVVVSSDDVNLVYHAC